MPEISIIMPVYNVEKDLPRALESVLNQTYADFELLCINDGSTDHSAEILADYASKNNRLKVITQQNSGVSSARNKGVASACGRFIVFLDSDDALSPYFLENMYRSLEQYPMADMAFCRCHKGEKEPNWELSHANAYLLGQPFEHYFLHHSPKLIASVWGKMYRRELLEGLSFCADLSCGEDLLFLYQALYRAKNFIALPEKLYFYRYRAGSIVRSALSSKRFDESFLLIRCLNGLFAKMRLSAQIRRVLNRFLARRCYNIVFKMPFECDPKHAKDWQRKYFPQLVALEKEGVFLPKNLSLTKKIRYFAAKWIFRSA